MINSIPANKYCRKIFDGTHDTPKPSTSGMPLVTSKNILGGKLNLHDAYNISEKDYISIQKRSAVSQWDVLFSMIGSVGEVYLEKNKDIPYAIKNVGVFSCGDEYRAKWLYYYLQSPASKKFINNYLAGAVQKFLGLGVLRDYPVFPFDETKATAVDILYSIDSKIGLNNKINSELELLAKTLYDYWFLQFEFPNKNGEPYKSSGGKMVWNEDVQRNIPEGWTTGKLSEMVNIYDLKRIPLSNRQREKRKGTYPYYGATQIMDYIDDYIFDGEYILLAEDGSVMNSDGFPVLQYVQGKFWVNNHAHILQAKDIGNNNYVFMSLGYIPVIRMMTGSVQKKVNQENLLNTKVVIPSKNILLKFADILVPMRKNIFNKLTENTRLSELRDWLLPMLMNGQISIKD